MNRQRLAGKVAIVTGGGSGIGQSIALRFAREGALVRILEIDEQKGNETKNMLDTGSDRIEIIKCDVSVKSDVERATGRIRSENGRLDVLVNNAAVAHIGNLENTTESDLNRIYRINVKGVYNCMHASVPAMVAQGGGVILNMASIVSKLGVADRFAYTMSKGAVMSMTYSVAKDYIDKNIRCNCICPARVHTPFVDNYLKENYPGEEDKIFQKLSAYQPIGRMAKPEEIASLALFLCSDEAAFITGVAYDIDGGVMTLR